VRDAGNFPAMVRVARTSAWLLALTITIGTGCTLDDDPVDEQLLDDELLGDELIDVEDDGQIDTAIDAGDCSAEGLGEDELTEFTTAHVVVDGELAAPCLGDEDPTLLDAWDLLAAITPPGQLADLGLFAAFRSGEDGDEVTLAFVNTVDDDGTTFQMSVNVDEYAVDIEQARLTMAHEFAHVFTSTTTQVDRSAEAADTCDTYFNGESCFLPDSLIAQWIDEFWGDGLIDDIEPGSEPSVADGQERCDLDPGFFGAYAASDPEEDFAEAFSAYVFAVPGVHPEQHRRLDWLADQPGLAEFRERAVDAGLAPVDFEFDPCGRAA
jgi:hypothetical protein